MGLITDEEANHAFRLWNECRPMALDVFLGVEDEVEGILTEKAVEKIVRGRLRGAGIFRNGPEFWSRSRYAELPRRYGILKLNIYIGVPYVSWDIGFQKFVVDGATSLVGWQTRAGTS